VRSPGEINGKSANVNNCLKNVIYPDYEGRWGDIPATELVVVFDADMAAKKNFFLKVGRSCRQLPVHCSSGRPVTV
jgi:hypothetical protein